jgi:membrane protease YdiL (CAAX protease family)
VSQITHTQRFPALFWRDLFLYLASGFGLFIGLSAAGVFIARLWFGETALKQNLWLVAIVAYITNFVSFAGTTWVFGFLRQKCTPHQLGFLPIRFDTHWVTIAIVIGLAMLPVRMMIGLAAEYAVNGNLDSLQNRTQLIGAGGLNLSGFALTMFGAAMLAPISEELFFRGAIYAWLRGKFSPLKSNLVSSALFGLAHFDSLGVILSSFILGVASAWLFERTRNMWTCISLHAFNNGLAIILVYIGMMAMNYTQTTP